MTATLPQPIPLDLPRAAPEALDTVARGVQAASYLLGTLETILRGPAGRAPDWQGEDADAAAARVGTVTVLATDVARAQRIAASRLALHRDFLLEITARIRALVVQQDDDYAAAWRRLGALPDPTHAMLAGALEAVAIVEEFRATEAARHRDHAALLEELADDAAATARVLADCSGVLGGSGRPGDEWRVVAHLALALPGWGDAELAARGTASATALMESDDPERLARDVLVLAGSRAFAGAFLAELGEEDLALLLTSLAARALDQDSPLALLLAAAFGAAVPGTGPADPVARVLEAVYLPEDDSSEIAQLTAAGMAAVLAVGAVPGRVGLRPATVLAWTRQLLAHEHLHGVPPGISAMPGTWDPALHDPAALGLGLLVAEGAPALAAELLGEHEVWRALLTRFWGDGGVLLHDLVGLAAEDAGAAGDGAVRVGLETIGAGLHSGDPAARVVDRTMVSALAPTLGAALAAHVDVAVDLLWVGVDGRAGDRADGLRGLGALALDGRALEALTVSVQQWLDAHPSAGFQPAAGDTAVPAVGLPSALLATWHYGHVLEFALDESEAQADANLRKMVWDSTVGQVDHVPGLPGLVMAQVEHWFAIVLRTDGTWDEGRFPWQIALSTLDGTGIEPSGAKNPIDVEAVRSQARTAFDDTTSLLGLPVPPESPPVDFWEPTRERIEGLLGD